MGDTSAIEWTESTWNPLVGCTKVSPGCDHCYAETLSRRNLPGIFPKRNFDLTLRPERLDQPLRWKKPRRIFVNSLSDLFHADVPDHYIAQVFAVMAVTPHHSYQLLTKRHSRMRSLLSSEEFRDDVTGEILALHIPNGPSIDHLADFERDWWPLANVWLGVSVETQQWADIRIPALLATPAVVRWVSAEPLLGPVDLHAYCELISVPGLDWVVVGGESGPGARPMHPDWARKLRDQCEVAAVPFLFKQWGEYAPSEAPAQHSIVFYPNSSNRERIVRLGKKNAGRELDGRTHDGYPA